MATRAPPMQYPVDMSDPRLTNDCEVCVRPPSAPPPPGSSFDVLVNCYKVGFAADAPTEFFKYDVSAVSRPCVRPPQAPVVAQDAQVASAPPEPTAVTPSGGENGDQDAAMSSAAVQVEAGEVPVVTPPSDAAAAQNASQPTQSGETGATTEAEEVPAGPDAAAPPPPVTPRRLPKRLLRVIVGELIVQQRELFGGTRVVHDGMAGLYAPTRLDSGVDMVFENVVLSPASGFRGAFDVTVKLVEAIQPDTLRQYGDTSRAAVDPMPVIRALNIVLRHLGSQRCVSVGQNLFSSRDSKPLGANRELHFGVHQSLRLGNPELHLNVDTAAAVFYAMVPLLDLVKEIAGVRDPQDLMRLRSHWARAIRRLRVVATHRPKASAQTICEVGRLGADQTMLLDRKGDAAAQPTRSVAAYFEERYAIKLRHPGLPVVNVGSRRFPEWLPMELCDVAPGQPCKDQQGVDVAEILKHCKQRPQDRKRSIEDGFASAAFENDPFLKAFGVRVSREMVIVAARRMNPPELRVSDRTLNSVNGQWNISQGRLYRPRQLVAWCVVNLSSLRLRDVDRAVKSLFDEATSRGLEVPDKSPPIVSAGGAEGRDIEALMRAAFTRAQTKNNGRHPDLIVVIKQRQDSDYDVIKRVSDTVLGVPSQCLLASKISRAKGQYWGNVVLKINEKLRGINFVLSKRLHVMTPAAIYFGADVNYRAVREGRAAPIYAVAASMDAHAASFAGRTTPYVGTSRLPVLLWELLVAYEQSQGTKPDRLFYFRDGVDDGRANEVFQVEIKAINEAWLMFAPKEIPVPPITYVVVSRHHHVRSFPGSARSGDRSGNTPAGSVIDQTIVDPRSYEFFLYGHNGLLGTSRPARYVVKRDDSNMRLLEMEQLCYDLCHVFGRSTKSVAVVAPVYYARVFAARGRCLLEYRSNDAGSTDSDADSSGGSQSEVRGDPMINVHRYLRNTLFCV